MNRILRHFSARSVASLLPGVIVTGCQVANPISCAPYWPDIPYSEAEVSAEPPSIRLEELWRAGGSAEGQEIAQPASVSTSSGGAVAVVDFGLGQVSVISPRGEWLGSWSRRGKGPGELTMPVASNWSGDTLVVVDIDQAKVVRYLASEYVDEIKIPTELVVPVAMTGSIEFVAVASDGSRPAPATARLVSVSRLERSIHTAPAPRNRRRGHGGGRQSPPCGMGPRQDHSAGHGHGGSHGGCRWMACPICQRRFVPNCLGKS